MQLHEPANASAVATKAEHDCDVLFMRSHAISCSISLKSKFQCEIDLSGDLVTQVTPTKNVL